VKATLTLPDRATYADYLAVEQSSSRRHEFFDGVIVAMAAARTSTTRSPRGSPACS